MKKITIGSSKHEKCKPFAAVIYVRIPNSLSTQFDMAYPAKMYAGLTLRLNYTSTGVVLTTVYLAVNCKLHKVLV